MNVSLCAEGSAAREESPRTKRLCLRYRVFGPCIYYVLNDQRVSLDESRALLLIIHLNRK